MENPGMLPIGLAATHNSDRGAIAPASVISSAGQFAKVLSRLQGGFGALFALGREADAAATERKVRLGGDAGSSAGASRNNDTVTAERASAPQNAQPFDSPGDAAVQSVSAVVLRTEDSEVPRVSSTSAQHLARVPFWLTQASISSDFTLEGPSPQASDMPEANDGVGRSVHLEHPIHPSGVPDFGGPRHDRALHSTTAEGEAIEFAPVTTAQQRAVGRYFSELAGVGNMPDLALSRPSFSAALGVDQGAELGQSALKSPVAEAAWQGLLHRNRDPSHNPEKVTFLPDDAAGVASSDTVAPKPTETIPSPAAGSGSVSLIRPAAIPTSISDLPLNSKMAASPEMAKPVQPSETNPSAPLPIDRLGDRGIAHLASDLDQITVVSGKNSPIPDFGAPDETVLRLDRASSRVSSQEGLNARHSRHEKDGITDLFLRAAPAVAVSGAQMPQKMSGQHPHGALHDAAAATGSSWSKPAIDAGVPASMAPGTAELILPNHARSNRDSTASQLFDAGQAQSQVASALRIEEPPRGTDGGDVRSLNLVAPSGPSESRLAFETSGFSPPMARLPLTGAADHPGGSEWPDMPSVPPSPAVSNVTSTGTQDRDLPLQTAPVTFLRAGTPVVAAPVQSPGSELTIAPLSHSKPGDSAALLDAGRSSQSANAPDRPIANGLQASPAVVVAQTAPLVRSAWSQTHELAVERVGPSLPPTQSTGDVPPPTVRFSAPVPPTLGLGITPTALRLDPARPEIQPLDPSPQAVAASDLRGATAPAVAHTASGMPMATAQNAAALVQQLIQVSGPLGKGPIEVSLSPDELGRVRMTLTPGENGMVLSILADRDETLALLRRNMDMLSNDLRALGYDNLSFQFGSGGSRGGSPEQGPDARASWLSLESGDSTGIGHQQQSFPRLANDRLDLRL